MTDPAPGPRTGLTRRGALEAMATLALAAGLSPGSTSAATPPSLKAAARARGLRYGSDIDNEIATYGRPFEDLFARQCELCAPNLNWAMTEPTPGAASFARVQPTLDLIARSNLLISGGHLLWWHHTPAWVRTMPPAEMDAALARRITDTCAKYGDSVWSWNVVNEAIEPKDGRPDGLRLEPMLTALGPDFIDTAFRRARIAAPHALLVYNDFGMEGAGAVADARRAALLRLLDGLTSRGVPIDAVGLQSHVGVGALSDPGQYGAFLDQIAARGLRIIITELDVSDVGPAVRMDVRDLATAATYRRLLSVALEREQVAAVLTWGLVEHAPARAPKISVPGISARRALPFGTDLQPKPIFSAIIDAFGHAPRRTLV